MSNELPQGWATVRIDRLCAVIKEKGRQGAVPYLEIGNVDIASKEYSVTDKPAVKGCRKARKHDVLVSKVRPTRGAIACVRKDEMEISSAFSVLRNQGALADKYLWFFLAWNSQYLKYLGENCTGTMYPTVSDESVVGYEIPVAPFNEQRRIVAKLEKLLGKVDACQQRLAKIPVLLKRFRQSVLAGACSGRLTADWRDKNTDVEPASQQLKKVIDQVKQEAIDATAPDLNLPNTWSFVLSKYMFSFVTSGSRGWAKYYSDKGPLFIRIGNLDHGTIYPDLSSVQSVRPPKGAEGTRTCVQPNDILVSITADVGMIALVPENIEEAYINQHIALARPIRGISPKFIAWYLASNEGGLKQFQELQRGMTKVGLGLDDIKSVWLPFPPLEEQHEIVRRVEAFFMFADQIEARFVKAKARVDQLTQSILAKAFRGELVPQDPNDEPASVLLERIKAERTKGETEPKGGGKKRLNVNRKGKGR